jgi:hypothetical protein
MPLTVLKIWDILLIAHTHPVRKEALIVLQNKWLALPLVDIDVGFGANDARR